MVSVTAHMQKIRKRLNVRRINRQVVTTKIYTNCGYKREKTTNVVKTLIMT